MTAVNLHKLINQRGAGNAEKALRKAGHWHELLTDTDRIDWLAKCANSVIRKKGKQSWKIDFDTDEEYDPDFFRQDIDNAATADMMESTTCN